MPQQNILIQRVDKSDIATVEKSCTCQLSPYDADLQNVSKYLAQAILLEVCTHPKPGLVTRVSNGAHSDMSILTFAMSSSVLGKAFYYLQDIGLTHNGTPKELFEKVRTYGVIAEQELLQVTKGVNTQRGILFAGGILSAAAGYCAKNNIAQEKILQVVREMTEGLVENELKNLKKKSVTAGEKLYREYGITGIRGEVENGFPSVVQYGLPAMREAFAKGANLNDALVHSLLVLMTGVDDSNVLWRTNIDMAQNVKTITKKILQMGSIFTKAGEEAIKDAEIFFDKHRISPGGSADLLSITIALYLLENKEFPVDIF